MKKCDGGRKEQHHTRKLWLLKIEDEAKTEMMTETTKVKVQISQSSNTNI